MCLLEPKKQFRCLYLRHFSLSNRAICGRLRTEGVHIRKPLGLEAEDINERWLEIAGFLSPELRQCVDSTLDLL